MSRTSRPPISERDARINRSQDSLQGVGAANTAADARPRRRPNTLTWLMSAYVVVAVGRIADLLPWLQQIPLAKLIGVLAIISAMRLPKDRTSATWKSIPPAKLSIVLMGITTLSILFSVLRSATFAIITSTVLAVVTTIVLTIKASRDWTSVKTMLYSSVFASIVVVLTVFSSSLAGRAGYSSSYDPNDFAFVMVGLLPLVVTFGITSRGTKRLLCVGLACIMSMAILLTESRGGFLGLIIDVVAMTFLLPVARRGQLQFHTSASKILARVVLLALIGIVGWQSLPETARARLDTISNLGSDYNVNVTEGPQAGRLAIWSRNLPLALARPWGWGAGAFGTVDGGFAGGRFRAPHNTFLQALIELGIPGFALFIAIILSSLRYLHVPSNRERENHTGPPDEPRAFARALGVGLIGLCVSGFFLSELFANVFWTFVTLSCAVGIVRRMPPGDQST
jgi:putative inorganic carbon (HCO3(-)) transporter